MQPQSFDRTAEPANPDAGRPMGAAAPDRAIACNDPELRQAIHKLRLTLDSLPE